MSKNFELRFASGEELVCDNCGATIPEDGAYYLDELNESTVLCSNCIGAVDDEYQVIPEEVLYDDIISA